MAGKSGKQARRSTPATTRSRSGAAATPERIKELERECRRLKAELDAAKARLEALETQRKELVDRIDWAIDSLHSLSEE